MRLQDKLQSQLSIFEISQLLVQSHVYISFWGSRCIYVEDYEGSVYIADFAERLLNHPDKKKYLNQALFQNKNLKILDRIGADYSFNKLHKAYLKADNLLGHHCSILQQIFSLIQQALDMLSYRDEREDINSSHNQITQIATDVEPIFLKFNQIEFNEIFGDDTETPNGSYLFKREYIEKTWIVNQLGVEWIESHFSRDEILEVIDHDWYTKKRLKALPHTPSYSRAAKVT